MLALAIALERFEMITRRLAQVAQVQGGIKVAELAACNLDKIRREAFGAFAAKHGFGDAIPEAPDHKNDVSFNDTKGKAWLKQDLAQER